MDCEESPGATVTVAGVNPRVRPGMTWAAAVRLTLPASPKLPSVIDETAELPAVMLDGLAGLEEIVKSARTVMITATVWLVRPLAPVTIMLYELEGVNVVVRTVSSELFDAPAVSERVPVENDTVSPATPDEKAAVRTTVPSRPKLEMEMVELP